MLPASAGPGDVGYEGAHFSGTGTAPTGAKPESKLWWNDGFWWAVMWDEPLGDNYIFKLNSTTQTWTNTMVEVDNRSGVRADVLWDGTKLFIASHPYANHAQTSTGGSLLYRLSYNTTTDTYTKDPGFPGTINNWRTESLVLAKDSTGRLWATWNQGTTIYINRSLTNQQAWGTPFALPVPGASGISTDDISSIVAFGGNQIGVMWSDQVREQMHFAVHRDGTAITTWTEEIPLSGPTMADDHINLKSDAGKVYAATKTSKTATDGDIYLLVRATNGTWTRNLVTEAQLNWTRPIVLLDTTNRVIHMVATAPETGGAIYAKATEMDNIAFPEGLGTTFIRDADGPDVNDATSTKQNLTSAMNMVVQASNDTTGFYWHNSQQLQPLPLNAGLSGTPTSGGVPLTVAFTDLSSGRPTAWNWNFGDGSTSALENPTHTYANAGVYSVTLTVTNALGQTSQRTMTDYVTVEPLAAGFTGTPTLGAAPLPTTFTDTSTGDPVAWSWNFGDGGTSTLRNPAHTYSTPGTYSVTLTVTGKNGATNTMTRSAYVTALPLTAEFTATPTSGPAPLTANFTDTTFGQPTSWSWNFGDGGTSTLRNPSHTYSAPGKYTVSLTVRDAAGATSTKTRTDLIDALPLTANFEAGPTFGSVPLTVNFSDTSIGTATTWAWDFGDGGTASVQAPSHTYTMPGIYTVRLTVTNASGATSTKTQENLITVSPDAIFTSAADAYADSSQPTRTTGTAASLRVRNGEVSPPHYVSYVRFDVAGLGAKVTAAKLRLQVTDSALDGGAVYLVDNSWTESGLTWTNAPPVTGTPVATLGAVDVGTPVEIELPRSLFAGGNGTYSLAIKSSTSGGAAWFSSREGVAAPQLILRVTPLPLDADFSASTTGGGAPLTVPFQDASDGEPITWAWDFGDGSTSTDQNPTHTYTQVGVYNVTLTVTDAKGGISTRTLTNFVSVAALDAEFRGTPASGPAPLATTFTDMSQGSPTAWSWDFGDGTTSTLRNPTHTYATPGSYTVTLTVTDAHGATNVDSRAGYVTAFPLTADFSGTPSFGSAPLTVTFSDTTIGFPTTWAWDFGDGTTSTAQNPTHTYAAAGVYTVALTVTDANGATSTKTRANFITASSENVFTPSADSYVDSSNPLKNAGTAGSVRVRSGTTTPPHYVSYLKFVVSGLAAPVSGGTLRLYVTDASTDGGALYTVADNSWTETGLNWGNAPVLGATPIASLGVANLGTWIEIPLSGSLFAAGNGVYTLAIKSDNPSGGAAWYSSREGTATPQLILR